MDPVFLTEKAAEELIRIRLEKQIPDDYMLRIGLKDRTESGFTYSLGFDVRKESDTVCEVRGMQLLIRKTQLLNILGMKIDYMEVNGRKGFIFTDPSPSKNS